MSDTKIKQEKQEIIKLTKCMRYEIIKPTNASWDDFGKVLHNLRYQSARIGNYMIQLLWQWDNSKNDYKLKNGKYPDIKEQPNYYMLLREKFPEVGVDIINQTRQWVANKYQKDRKEIFLLKKSITSFRDNMPICIYNGAYHIENDENSFTIDTRLLPSTATQNRFSFIIKSGEKSKKIILERIQSGEYKQGMMQIVRDKNKKWFVLLSYTFEIKPKELKKKDRIMNIIFSKNKKDIILKIDGTNFERELNCEHIEHVIQQFSSRIEQLKNQKIKGLTKNIDKILSNLQVKQNNYKATENHKLSKKIIDNVLKFKCSEVYVEGDEWFIDWNLYDLKNKIQYKAKEKGLTYR